MPYKAQLRFLLTTNLPLRHNLILKRPQRLILKELFMQLLLIKLLCASVPHASFKFTFLYKTRRLFMTTRAPYRYKLTRNQYLLERYHYRIVLTFGFSRALNTQSFIPKLLMLTEALGRLNFAHGTIKTVALSLPTTYTPLLATNGRI